MDLPTEKRSQLCRLLPKIELHQHLSGSCRVSSIREILAAHGIDEFADFPFVVVGNGLAHGAVPPPSRS